jgi:hypothetical protein
MQPAGELDSPGQSIGGDKFTGDYSSTGCIQPMEDEGNTCSPFFGFGQSSADLFVGLSKDEPINLRLPFFPELPPIIIQYM